MRRRPVGPPGPRAAFLAASASRWTLDGNGPGNRPASEPRDRLQSDHGRQPARPVVDGKVDVAVGALAHITYPPNTTQQGFLRYYSLPVHGEARELLTGQPAYAHVPAPGRELVAAVDHEPRRRDGRHPVVHRLLRPLLRRAPVDDRYAVLDAVTDHRPAVVEAGPDQVQLVPALRAVLVQPQVPGLRVQRQALRVPVPVAPDLRQRVRPPHERVVLRDAP